jgi:ABC-type nitrate/sulfonate/bicarbonate transport system substrate-binding protein
MAHASPLAAIAGCVILSACLLAGTAADTAEPTMLRVNTFPNAKALALEAGIANGIFARHGLAVALELTESSQAQRSGLAAGKFQIAQGAVDNAVAMADAGQDVVIVAGGDSGMNELFAQSGINSIADLRGRTILVDAPDTAYALQVKQLLARSGIAAGDYALKPAGASPFRFRAMVADRSNAAAILNPPFTAEARRLAMVSLGNTVALLGPYQAVGVFVRRDWAEQNRETLERYLAAYVEAGRFVRDPAHRAENVALLMREHKLDAEIAARTYDELTDSNFGFTPDARFDPEGFRNLLALRAELEGKGAPSAAGERYVDLGYYERALKLVGR